MRLRRARISPKRPRSAAGLTRNVAATSAGLRGTRFDEDHRVGDRRGQRARARLFARALGRDARELARARPLLVVEGEAIEAARERDVDCAARRVARLVARRLVRGASRGGARRLAARGVGSAGAARVLLRRRAAIEPLDERLVLARREPHLPRAQEHLFGLLHLPGAREGVREARRDVAARPVAERDRFLVGYTQPRHGLARSIERDVEEVPEVVRVPRVLRRALEGSLVRAHREAVVPQQGLRQAEERPAAIVIRALGDDALREDRRAPRVLLREELGELPVREDALLASGRRGAGEPVEHGEHVARVERSAERGLDVLAQPLPRLNAIAPHGLSPGVASAIGPRNEPSRLA